MGKGCTISFDGQEVVMETAIIGGIVNEKENEMTGIYCGPKAIEDLGVAMLQAMRGCIKTARTEFEMPIETAAEFMAFTLQEALNREMQYGHLGEVTFRSIKANKGKDY